MSHEYAMSRVKDALEKSGGNQLKAQRLLLSWLEKDQSLLFGLVAPHMQGIITHAVSHVAYPQQKKTATPKIDIEEAETGEFGAAVLASLKGGKLASEAVDFGHTSRKVSKPGKASKTHIDAIHAIAGASKGKDGKSKK